MSLKKLTVTVLIALLAVLAAGAALAQTGSDIAVGRSDLQANRQAIVAANLTLTEAEAAAFWPLYREYRGEVAKIGDKSVQLITDYATAYNAATLTDVQAMDLTKSFLEQQKATVELKQKYLSKFAKIVPGKTAARFFQIENKLDAVVAVGIADQVPLVE
jgi:hypothetical protein